jgi:endonuclease/exonuclease/phosphatase family metal-dependent hydrolase
MPSTHPAPISGRFALFLLAFAGLTALSACAPDSDVAGADSSSDPSEDALAGNTRIRLMGANTTSGNLQSYDPGEGTRIFQGTDPDIVMIQEFNFGTNSDADIRTFVNTAFGTTFSYFREAGAQIPNGVISRYPIIASGEWDDSSVTNRDFAFARIDIPGPVDLWAVSVHLLTSGASVRNTEATQLVSFIKQNIPAGDYLVIGGDFNTDARTEACISTLSQVVVTSGSFPADRNGNSNTNATRSKPYDWVLADADLNAFKTSTLIGGSTFTNGLVADTRVYSPLSEISPALASDSGSTNMQHMGVIRDFLVPGDTTTTKTITVTAPNGGESYAGGSAQSITWTQSGITNIKIELTTDGTTFSVLSASTVATQRNLTWTVPSTATTSARVRVSDAADGTVIDQSDGPFTITVSGGGTGKVFMNEIMANEPGSDAAGEFVELVNTGTASVDLSGFTLSDSAGVRHTFAPGTLLAAGKALVVFGGAIAIPTGLSGAVAASTGALSLTNGGDSVILKDASGVTVDSFTYGSALSSTDGVSMNRSPDASSTGSFLLHTSLSSSASSPGTRADGSAF